MGIFCKIGVAECPNHEFSPGSVVSGTIKYAFDKNTVAKKISLSLKGKGMLTLIKRAVVNGNQHVTSYVDKEEYVSFETILIDDYEGKQFSSGEYTAPFNFELPENIPPSLKYHHVGEYDITCKIAYHIKIKFETSGFLKFNKVFDKEIKVVTGITPKLPLDPIIYGERKSFFQPFKKHKGVLNLKACIKCSVLEPGETAEVAYEILNETNKAVEAVETKLITIYKFNNKNSFVTKEVHDVKNTESKTSGIPKGSTENTPLEIEIPSDLCNIENSKLVSREYALQIKVCLPLPHKNLQLEVPIQVGKILISKPFETIGNNSVEYKSPPSYWEAMNVCDEKSSDYFSEDIKLSKE